MGKYSGSLNWTDVESMLRALDGIHSGRTRLVISAVGIGATGGIHTEVITEFNALPGSQQFKEVRSESDWPCKDHKDYVAHLISGLYHHDHNIEAAYEQSEIPK